MSEFDIDDIFGDKLRDYSSQVPADMWQRIQKDKRRRYAFPLWLMLAGLVLCIAGGGYFLLHTNNTDGVADKQNEIIKNKIQKDNSAAAQSESENSSGIAKNDDNGKQTLSAENKFQADNNDNQNNLSSSTTKKQISLTPLPFYTKHDKKFTEKEEGNKSLENPGLLSSDLNEKQNKNDGMKKEETNNDAAKNISIANTENATDSLNTKSKSLLITKNSPDSVVNTSVKKADAPVSVKLHNPVQFFLEVYGSPDIPLSNIKSDSVYYLAEKKKTSEFLVSQTFGARLGVKINDHFSAKIGLQYSGIQEKFNYTQNNAIRYIDVPVTRVITDSFGETQFIKDTILYGQYGTRHITVYNHYRSWDVPVLISYATGSDKLKVSLSAGIILNIHSGYTGKILDASLLPVDIDSMNAYRNNTGVSLYMGLGFAKSIGDKMDVFTEPYFRYRLGNMTGMYSPFTQRIHIGGLSIGLHYHFLQAGQHK